MMSTAWGKCMWVWIWIWIPDPLDYFDVMQLKWSEQGYLTSPRNLVAMWESGVSWCVASSVVVED